MSDGIYYPNITVELSGSDGNAFAILAKMNRAFIKEGILDRWEDFRNEATSGDYDHLLQTCMKWVNVT